MKEYLDELLDYYDVKRTNRKGIWIKTKDGNIIPFDFDIKKEDNMQEKIRIKQFHFYETNNTWEWNLEILDKELSLKGRDYEILPYNNKEYIYIKYFYDRTYKLYDTGKGLTDEEINELRDYINEDINNTNNKYYYIYIPMYNNNAILEDRDDSTNVDKQRKEMGNYFKTYEQAEKVWNILQQVLKDNKEV
ncbi:hypothetical protein [Fusobacterium phage Fnu1]|uniref:Uncharacterized protein n=1 Tax=Fusobacterium phage Fnu1 TaxID=2530024 RepID=A0A481W667_9CAUD|nr:hypothetical protein KMD24_gp071 [Fusobacterium phage Fnu1]QBJ04120.1 hypothetical protein [Fusobacterium phage Fnu1]